MAGFKVGADAVVAGSEVAEDDVPNGDLWMGGWMREMDGDIW